MIQTYILEDKTSFKIKGKAYGLDLFIGEINYLDKGYGTEVLKVFMDYIVEIDPKIVYFCIDPEVNNKRAIHVYEKVGFKTVQTKIDKNSGLRTCYMIRKV